jgi:hypothetical protein
LRFVKVEESREGSKLCAFNVDFQDVDKVVTVVFHELAETPHLNVYVGTVVVDGAKCPGLEMGSVGVYPEFRTPLQGTDGVSTGCGIGDMETHAGDAKIVSPDLALRGLLQKFRFEGGFTIYACSARAEE